LEQLRARALRGDSAADGDDDAAAGEGDGQVLGELNAGTPKRANGRGKTGAAVKGATKAKPAATPAPSTARAKRSARA
jgi:hypothetical protein